MPNYSACFFDNHHHKFIQFTKTNNTNVKDLSQERDYREGGGKHHHRRNKFYENRQVHQPWALMWRNSYKKPLLVMMPTKRYYCCSRKNKHAHILVPKLNVHKSTKINNYNCFLLSLYFFYSFSYFFNLMCITFEHIKIWP